jgi:1-acyl-sn-glycerol-3-phosphate acyltransferase
VALLVAAVVDGQTRKMLFGMRPGPAGAVWVSGWCQRIVRALGIVCAIDGPLPEVGEGGLAVVSNHLSYLDILVYSAVRPFVMVSKTEVRSWPLLGWITAQAGTVYVERADVKGGKTQTHSEVNALMAEAFRSGLPVLFFPEGTTTDGETVLPFRRGLFNAVVYGEVPVRAAAMAYALDEANDGASVANDVCYWGDMVFGPHLFKALGLRGLRVQVSFGDAAIGGEDRFALALNSRDTVVAMYEELSGVTSIARQVAFPSQQSQYLFDRPVEGLGSVYDEAGVRG